MQPASKQLAVGELLASFQTCEKFRLMSRWEILHAPPSGNNSRIANVFDEQIPELFRKIEILLGEEIEPFNRLLAQRRCIFDVTLVHFEYGTIERSHLPAPINHFIHVCINDIDGLLRVRNGIRTLPNRSQRRNMNINHSGVVITNVGNRSADGDNRYHER